MGQMTDEALLAEVELVLEGNKTILEAAKRLRDCVADGVRSISVDVALGPGLPRDTIYRCIAVRAQETFSSLLLLADADAGHHARVLLRPLVEDHLFLGWLTTLDEHTATRFLELRAGYDIADAYEAQRTFLPKAYETLGVVPVPSDSPGLLLGSMVQARERLASKLRELAKAHGWSGRGPTVKAMAAAADRLDVYDFFYLASSRSVHSNLHEMGRMVWGDSQTMAMSISSAPMIGVHRDLAITYGCWIYAELMEQLAVIFPELREVVESRRWSVWVALVLVGVARNGMLPPLVWERELAWATPRATSQAT